MVDDITAIRLRMAQIVSLAEDDEKFRQLLSDDPASVLAAYSIPDGAVEEYSQSLLGGRQTNSAGALESDDPTGCIHTNGCNDFTCISSSCGPTCYITIHIDAPDA